MRRKGDSLSFVLVTVNYRGHRYTMHPHEFGSLPDPLVIIREDSYKAVCGRVTNGKIQCEAILGDDTSRAAQKRLYDALAAALFAERT